MSGRARLPSGEPRKASQRHSRRAGHAPTLVNPTWRPGDQVHWRSHTGSYLRDVGEEEAEINVAGRTYRVRRADLRPGT